MNYLYNLGISFYSISEKYPDRTALKYPDGSSFDFRTLNNISNQIARYLMNKSVQKGDVIAIFNEKTIYGYSLMIACLKIGAIYTNLDISSPWTRIEKIVYTCKPKIVFFDKLSPEAEDFYSKNLNGITSLDLNNKSLQNDFLSLDKENLIETGEVHGGDPAYIMFTSGSTGFPKGALMSHNNVLNFIQWGKTTFSITEKDVFTNANPIYFDNSVFDFYVSLYNGASLISLSHDLVKNANQLVKAINKSECSIWFSVPSLLVYLLTTKSLTKDDFKTIKRISFGGEGFPKNKLRQLFNLFGDRMSLYNVYGPTECTCICSSYLISEEDFNNMYELAPLGNIAPNFGYEIIPLEARNPDIGELALIGPCVGLGYYNDEERTLKSFVKVPNRRFGQLMYKTGDIVERASNGYLHFKGRIDNQVKHMGYRIELEEIESAFSTLPYINESGVIYEKINTELGQIKAFVSISDKSVKEAKIINDLKNILPPYMIPRILVVMEVLPKNANGKVDRRQLAIL